jgi:hypothetical protein
MSEAPSINITPTPDVLIALTNTPLKPLDAICELIDNGIDAFSAAELEGNQVEYPWIQIQIPGEAQVRRGEGVIRISDNGAGLDMSGLERALTAGFSSKNQFDTLGLFGMGFNIASGKLGMKTVVTTARKSDRFALQTTLDLPRLVHDRSFRLEITEIEKPSDFDHGTIVEVSGWWPEGTQNSGFVMQLARLSKPRLAQQIGRRYASILRRTSSPRIQMFLNEESIKGFEHCVWSESRFVERQGWGRIPALIEFDEVLFTQRHCIVDRTIFSPDSDRCSQCDGKEFRTIHEKIRGWVGIQRFDDSDNFGIDVVRNGRAILVGEKDAFFSLIDEVGQKTKEYPSDGIYGRIVGEIHLDHVPVDFTKQDFQRASDSWKRAVESIRGQSLLESKWESGYRNESPIGKLFKGYRKVRKVGRDDMYMGRYDEAQSKSVRISREVERDYFKRFEAREDGYYDDEKWWELVESATVPPVRGLIPCQNCSFQNREDDEECNDCGEILRGKSCIECGEKIRASATSCPFCSVSQVPVVDSPWKCLICESINGIDDDNCSTCHNLRGLENPASELSLSAVGDIDSKLSFENRTFELSDSSISQPITLNTYVVPGGSISPVWGKPALPTSAFKSSGLINIYLDSSHSIFKQMGSIVEATLAVEVAQVLHASNPNLWSLRGFSVANLAASVLSEVWGEELTWSQDSMIQELSDMVVHLTELLLGLDESAEFYKELSKEEQSHMTTRLIAAGQLDNLETFSLSGQYLAYLPPASLMRFYRRYSESWFENVWKEGLPKLRSDGSEAIAEARARIIGSYGRALEDCLEYLSIPVSDDIVTKRVKSSLEFVQDKLA